MEALVHWFSQNLSQYISPEGAVFIISMIPLLELRGGLLAASLLKISAAKAIPLCIVGNIIPIPFILLFIRQIFKVLKKTKLFRGLVIKLEDRAMRKSDQVKKYEFWGLMLFVGIPLPGTGAWTGSLIASLLEIDIKKSSLAIFCGIIMATVIMYVVSYGLVGSLVRQQSWRSGLFHTRAFPQEGSHPGSGEGWREGKPDSFPYLCRSHAG